MNYEAAKWKSLTEFLKRAMPGPMHKCWLWPGKLTRDGYGQIEVPPYRFFTHILSCTLHHGKKPGLEYQVLHADTCTSRACWKPACIRWGTKSENERMKKRGKPHGRN